VGSSLVIRGRSKTKRIFDFELGRSNQLVEKRAHDVGTTFLSTW
jgi:hypothetical protein